MTDLVNKEVVKGYLLGPFDHIPYEKYRINPIGLAEHKYSKKKRLIVDMSAPHQDVNNPSLNSLIDKITCSLKYTSIDDAIRVFKELRQNAWLMKTDITDAFKLLPIKPALWPYHGICWDGKYYFFTRLVFGSRSSPKLFDNLSRAICWVAQKNITFSTSCTFWMISSLLSQHPLWLLKLCQISLKCFKILIFLLEHTKWWDQ